MKLLVELHDINHIKQYNNVEGWIIGVDYLSNRAFKHFNIVEIKEIISLAKIYGQNVSINACKMFNDQDLSLASNVLDELAGLDIAYFFYTDLGFYQMAKSRNLNLVYQAETYLTNQSDVNLTLLENSSVVVSPEISLGELQEITNNSLRPVMIEGFGTWTIFHSKRPLLTNYFLYRGWDFDQNKDYHLIEEIRTETYKIEEDENGTKIYFPGFFYLWDEISTLNNISHLIIRLKFIDNSKKDLIIEKYDNYLSTGEGTLSDLGLELTKSALNRKTVLRKEAKI